MQDRYLFKAKRKDDGEWVIGNRIDDGVTGQVFIHAVGNSVNESDKVGEEGCLQFVAFEVAPSTICQCTGLKDKNGNLIWENDIVKFEDLGEEGYEYKEGFDFENKARVEFTEGRWSLTDFVSDNSGVIDEMYNHAEFMNLWGECEVIGNVFDNPELLEV